MAQIDLNDPWAVEQARAQESLQAARQNQQFKAPQGQMVGRVFVPASPLAGIAEALRNYNAAKEEKSAMDKLQGIGAQRQEAQGRDMSAFVQALRGTPAVAPQRTGADIPAFDEADAAAQQANVGGYSGMTGGQAAKAGDPYAAYGMAMSSQSPMVRQIGMQGMAQLPQLQQQAELRREALAQQAEQNALNRQSREDMLRMQLEGQRQMRELTAGQKQAQIIDTDQGKMRVMPNGTLAPLMDVSGNAISGPKGPQGTLARQNEAQQALNAIKQAEEILPNATSSGLGSAVDATAAFFGKSTTGAQNASKLRAIEGELVSKMPKMSGPQSDKDVALYKQMAGVVGDATQPVATRQAALEEVKKIQQRYAGPAMNLGATGNPNSVMNQRPAGGVVDFGSLK